MSDVDIRCAAILARIAVQALADLHPEAASAIDHALGYEIQTAQTQGGPDVQALVALLTDVRARLAGDDGPRTVSEDSVWYIE